MQYGSKTGGERNTHHSFPANFSHIFWKSFCSMQETVATYIENVLSSVQERFKTAGEEHKFVPSNFNHMSWCILEPSECTHTDFNKKLFKKICAACSISTSWGLLSKEPRLPENTLIRMRKSTRNTIPNKLFSFRWFFWHVSGRYVYPFFSFSLFEFGSNVVLPMDV